MGYGKVWDIQMGNPTETMTDIPRYNIEITHNILDYSFITTLEYLPSSGYFALLNAISPANTYNSELYHGTSTYQQVCPKAETTCQT